MLLKHALSHYYSPPYRSLPLFWLSVSQASPEGGCCSIFVCIYLEVRVDIGAGPPLFSLPGFIRLLLLCLRREKGRECRRMIAWPRLVAGCLGVLIPFS